MGGVVVGHLVVRQSSGIVSPASSVLTLPSGSELSGLPGSSFTVPVTVTNTLTHSAVFRVDAADLRGFTVRLSQRRSANTDNKIIILKFFRIFSVSSTFFIPDTNDCVSLVM